MASKPLKITFIFFLEYPIFKCCFATAVEQAITFVGTILEKKAHIFDKIIVEYFDHFLLGEVFLKFQ